MKNKIRTSVAVLFFICTLCVHMLAVAGGESTDKICSENLLDKRVVNAIPRLEELSQGVVNKYCVGELSTSHALSLALLEFLYEANNEFKSIGITESIFSFQAQVTEAKKAIEEGKAIINIAQWLNPNEAGIQFYEGIKVEDQDACDKAVKQAFEDHKIGVKTCRELLDNFQVIYSHAQYPVQNMYTVPVKKYLRLAQNQWDDFFNKSRSQTSLEMALNGHLWQKNKVAGSFLSPPDMQWILLHPSVVVENLSKAPDGSNTQEGVMVEIGGVNWWGRDKWYQLSGGSLVSLYSDRANIADWGCGFAFHFGNNLTLGVVNHGGSNGFFISVDVLEIYKDKRSLMDSYIGTMPN